jgi:hypothetical protein
MKQDGDRTPQITQSNLLYLPWTSVAPFTTHVSALLVSSAELSKSLCSQKWNRTSPKTNQFDRFFCQALLRTITKIFNSTFEELNLLTDGKHGFKHGQCTTHALLPLSESTPGVFHNNKTTLASFWTHRRVYQIIDDRAHIGTYTSRNYSSLHIHGAQLSS